MGRLRAGTAGQNHGQSEQGQRDILAGMHAWIKRIHMYLGLLNYVTLTVFGIAGLTATFEPGPRHPPPPAEARFEPFVIPPNASDKEVADTVFQNFHFPLSNPIPKGALRRNPENELVLNFYAINGPFKVTILEKENRLRIEPERNNIWRFLNNVHSVTQAGNSRHLRIRLWGWYNELAIWSLIAMSLSGVYLWLASRPRFRWAQISFAAGTGIFIVLYALTR